MTPHLELNLDVVCSPLDDGGVLLDLSTKQYFALNATGLSAWQHLEDGGSLETLALALSAAGVAADANGLAAFAQALLDHGLATLSATTAGAIDGAPPMPPRGSSWVAPTLTPHGRPLADVILSPFDPTVPVPE
jgi:hypothetical protein